MHRCGAVSSLSERASHKVTYMHAHTYVCALCITKCAVCVCCVCARACVFVCACMRAQWPLLLRPQGQEHCSPVNFIMAFHRQHHLTTTPPGHPELAVRRTIMVTLNGHLNGHVTQQSLDKLRTLGVSLASSLLYSLAFETGPQPACVRVCVCTCAYVCARSICCVFACISTCWASEWVMVVILMPTNICLCSVYYVNANETLVENYIYTYVWERREGKR